MPTRKTRKQRKEDAAERVCRELRFQLVNYGGVADFKSLKKHFSVWMNNSNEDKYKRP